ncbi:MAG: FAD-binding oxidoreductase [Candidatus Nanohaloarchaea archaeon]|nr:FAD-binding oxidoreductase [Candidatus Nanohaloarchaea archaeon]
MILGQVAGALYWKSLDYQVWRKLHMLGYFILFLGFAHSFLLGTETALPPDNPLGYWWLFLALVAVFFTFHNLVYRRVFKPQRFEVVGVRKETPDVTTVELEPLQNDIENLPGQFAFVRFDSGNVPAEEHHFTISSGAGREGITFTVKDVGDFTSKLDRLEEGETADVEGPYGSFTTDGTEGPYTFIAGGIGITPLMSMIRTMHGSGGAEQIRLIYGNRTRDDIVFRDELSEIEENSDWLEVEHVLSEEDAEGFRHGYVDRELLEELVLEDSEIFLCGPPPMMESVRSDLEEMGVDPARIHFERFSLRE